MTEIKKNQKEVVVLQHGFLCGSGYWQSVKRGLDAKFEVIVPVLPGFSENASAQALNSINGFAKFLLEFLDARGIERFHLLGHSMGGMIAQEVTMIAPERVHKLVLFGTGPIGNIPGRFETFEESRTRLKREGAELLIENTVATWFVKGRDDPHYQTVIQEAKQASMEAILGGYTAMEGWRGLERLRNIDASTLIVWGNQDRSYNESQVKLLRDGIHNGRLAVMPGCSHNAHLEDPSLFLKLVSDFLAED